ADGDLAIVLRSQPHAVGRFVPLLDFDDAARFEVVTFDEAKEGRVLVGDAAHFDARLQRTGEKRVVLAPVHEALGVRNRIAVRIDLRTTEHLVDPLDQALRYG